VFGGILLGIGLFEFNVNANVFHGWVVQCLLPALPSNSVVVMDNASFHKRQDIQEAIAQAGHILEYLPPYSPDLNPIEKKWAQAKETVKVFTIQLKNAVIPAWMLESSHRDVKPCYAKLLFIIMLLPSVALDSGIHARMTGLKITASKNEDFA
jgi:hypothetical protein